MKSIGLIIAAVLLTGAFVYHYAALELFNALVPKDSGSTLLVKDVAYGEGPRLKLDIYAPTQGQGPWPVIIFVHGGSWSSGNKNPYEFVGRALAAQGFLTILPNYRLHPEHPFPAFVEDTALAIDWTTRHAGEYGGDPKHIIATGHSAGAYNVALAILDKHYLAALGTDVSAIKGVALLAAPLDFLPLDPGVAQDVFGAVKDLPATQPITYARADVPPFFMAYGSVDTTVRPKNSINMAAALKAAGAQVELKAYDGVGHVGIVLALSTWWREKAPTLADITAFAKDH
ncbi:MAG TPA: alpha/beta hydrolase [Aestuariivirga sp.]